MGRKSKYIEGIERGYDMGISSAVGRIFREVEEMKDSKAKKALLDYIWKNFEEYIPNFGSDEPSAYERKFCYHTTYTYRDIPVEIFSDDNGQCFYFYYKGKSYGCGSFNPDYEEVVKYVIDHDLDDIINFAERGFYGGFCKYANWEHTKVDFIFRGELVETFDVDESDPESVVKIWKECERRLEELWKNPEFIKAEEERKSGGNLYFSEMLESLEEGESKC